MNTSTIIDMIAADPKILDDIPGFVGRMNAKTITQTVRRHVEVVDETITISLAQQHGGDCTLANVAAAQAILARQPLVDATEQIAAAALAGIHAGQLQSKQAVLDFVNQAAKS